MHWSMLVKARDLKELTKKMAAFEIFGANGTESKHVKETDDTDYLRQEYLKDGEREKSFKEYVECYHDYNVFHVSTNMSEVDVEDKKWGYILVDDNDEVVKVINRDNPNGHYDYYSVKFPFIGYYQKEGVSYPFGLGEDEESHIDVKELYSRRSKLPFCDENAGFLVSDIDLTKTMNYLYKKCRHEYDTMKAATEGLPYQSLDYFIKKAGLNLKDYVWLKKEYKPALAEYEAQLFYQAIQDVYAEKNVRHYSSKPGSFDMDMYDHPLIVKTWSFEKYFEHKRNTFFSAYGYVYRGKWIERDHRDKGGYEGEKVRLDNQFKWGKETHRFMFEKELDKKVFIVDVHR